MQLCLAFLPLLRCLLHPVAQELAPTLDKLGTSSPLRAWAKWWASVSSVLCWSLKMRCCDLSFMGLVNGMSKMFLACKIQGLPERPARHRLRGLLSQGNPCTEVWPWSLPTFSPLNIFICLQSLEPDCLGLNPALLFTNCVIPVNCMPQFLICQIRSTS